MGGQIRGRETGRRSPPHHHSGRKCKIKSLAVVKYKAAISSFGIGEEGGRVWGGGWGYLSVREAREGFFTCYFSPWGLYS